MMKCNYDASHLIYDMAPQFAGLCVFSHTNIAPNNGPFHCGMMDSAGCLANKIYNNPPPFSGVKNVANGLKAVGWGAGLYKAIGMSIVASGGTDLPESGAVAIGGLFSGRIGGLMGLAADYHLGCTP